MIKVIHPNKKKSKKITSNRKKIKFFSKKFILKEYNGMRNRTVLVASKVDDPIKISYRRNLKNIVGRFAYHSKKRFGIRNLTNNTTGGDSIVKQKWMEKLNEQNR